MNDDEPISRSFVSLRQPLHYVDWGNPSRPLLLLIHGSRDHCRSWDRVARSLRADWQVVAPDLRGHGDSPWSSDGNYDSATFVYDLAQLIRHLDRPQVTIVGHSLGGNIALRYAGAYFERVRQLVAIEGLGPSPDREAQLAAASPAEQARQWIEQKRAAADRPPKRYATLEEAVARMRSSNEFLSDEQARHLTVHGVRRNEDGTWSWKFDNLLHVRPYTELRQPGIEAFWNAIACPTLLVYGSCSWASNPARDGRLRHFRTARVVEIEQAGHWLHHDRFEAFMAELIRFLGEQRLTAG